MDHQTENANLLLNSIRAGITGKNPEAARRYAVNPLTLSNQTVRANAFMDSIRAGNRAAIIDFCSARGYYAGDVDFYMPQFQGLFPRLFAALGADAELFKRMDIAAACPEQEDGGRDNLEQIAALLT